jgi:hypothetical protein
MNPQLIAYNAPSTCANSRGSSGRSATGARVINSVYSHYLCCPAWLNRALWLSCFFGDDFSILMQACEDRQWAGYLRPSAGRGGIAILEEVRPLRASFSCLLLAAFLFPFSADFSQASARIWSGVPYRYVAVLRSGACRQARGSSMAIRSGRDYVAADGMGQGPGKSRRGCCLP